MWLPLNLCENAVIVSSLSAVSYTMDGKQLEIILWVTNNSRL